MAKQAMQLSEDGAIESICNEAIVLSRYKDSKGIWTIGVGRTAAAGGHPNPNTFTGTLTIKEVIALFRKDSQRYVDEVNRALKVKVTQYEFDALFDFHYNTGAIATAALTKALNAGNRAKAAKLFMSWSKPKEIIERRERSMELFLTGKYQQRFAMLYPVTAKGYPNWSKGRRVDVRALLNEHANLNTPQAEIDLTPIKVVSGPTYITKGAKGAEVAKWQQTLVDLGYQIAVDKDFGNATLEATKLFQSSAGIMVDGRVGAGTRKAAADRLKLKTTVAEQLAAEPVEDTTIKVGSTTVTLTPDDAAVATSDNVVVVDKSAVSTTGDMIVIADKGVTLDGTPDAGVVDISVAPYPTKVPVETRETAPTKNWIDTLLTLLAGLFKGKR